MPVVLSKPYCSLEDVQRETRNSQSDDSDKQNAAINYASRWIDDHCGRDFWFHDHSSTALRLRSSGIYGDMIALPYPIKSIDSVKTYALDGTGESDLELDDEVWWETKGETGLVHSAVGDFPCGRDGYVDILGQFGYTISNTTSPPSDVPATVRRACTLVASAWSVTLKKQNIGLDGSIQELLETGLPNEAVRLLKKVKASHLTTF